MMIGLVAAFAAVAGMVGAAGAAAPAADTIGVAAAITASVTGKLAEETRTLAKGDDVFRNEAIETGDKAQAEFVFKDDTKLAVGPNSKLRLDRFVYNPDKKSGEILLNAAAGSFRFITGLADKTAYRIKTPVATIGVRGTVFDGYVNEQGEVAVLLIDGEVDVCSAADNCRPVREKGRFVRVMRGGIFKGPHLWDNTLFGGIGLAKAFPFAGKRLLIDPVRRFNPEQLMRKASLVPKKVLGDTARAGRKVMRSGAKGAGRVGRGVKDLGRKTGRGVKNLGRKTGRGVRNLGRATGRTLRRITPFK